MPRGGFDPLTLMDLLKKYINVWKAEKQETNCRISIRDLQVARRFMYFFRDASGVFIDLELLHRIFPFIPSTGILVMDPKVGAELLRHHDLKELSADTPAHRALKPFKGSFI